MTWPGWPPATDVNVTVYVAGHGGPSPGPHQ